MDAESSFGHWVKGRRKALGLTQRGLAHQIGCSLSVIQKIEIDDRRPSREIAELLAYHLELGAEEHDAFVHRARARLHEPQLLLSVSEPPERFDNLPAPLTALVGREWEVETLSALLSRDDVRLLTVSGPPGIGKTRLAIEVARTLIDDFADGACFVALAPLAEARYVLTALARALGAGELEHVPLLKQLKVYLRNKHMLLVLDNFEHVLPAAPLLAELLESAPRLKVLVTSRSLLHVYGEHEFVAPPLELPDLKHLPATIDLIRYSAIELFVQRARAAKLDFLLSEQNAASVAELCVHLDGLPLAIELAAARSKQLSPAALLSLLTSAQGEGGVHWEVLAAKARNLPPRQQTLYAAIDWSYNLLTPVEQRVFRSLGVFAGGCNMPALAAVNGMPPDGTANWLLDVANALVDKSLVVAQWLDGEQRFALLEMIREYALQQLAANGELERMRTAHAEFYLTFGDAIDREIRARQETRRLATYSAEHDNLRAALTWGLQHDPARCLSLVAQLAEFGNSIDLHFETRDWLERVLARVEPQDTRAYAHAARRMAAVLWIHAELYAAEAWIQTCIKCWRSIGDEFELGVARLFSALIFLHRDEYEAALVPACEAAVLVRLEPTMHWLPISLFTLGTIRCVLGDYGAATTLTEEGLALFRLREDRWGEALGVICMADVPYAQGDYAAACPRYAEALQELQGVINAPWLVTRVTLSLGKSLWHLEKPEAAAEHWRESIAVGRAIGARKYVAGSLLMLGLAAQQTGDADQAHQLCSESLSIYRFIQHDAGIAYALSGLAGVLAERSVGVSEEFESSHLATAAGVLAAAAHLRTGRRMLQDDVERQHYERIVARVRSGLSAEVFATAWARGQTVSPEQAVACVLPHT